MNAFDVGIMNYQTAGTWTAYGFPLKMFEYMAAGLPVVGTALPSIRKFGSLIQIVERDDAQSVVRDLLESLFVTGELNIATGDESPALSGEYHNAIELSRDTLAVLRVKMLNVINFDSWFEQHDH